MAGITERMVKKRNYSKIDRYKYPSHDDMQTNNCRLCSELKTLKRNGKNDCIYKKYWFPKSLKSSEE
jgi:hypothetical protein